MFDTHGRIKCGTIAAPDFNGSLADWTGTLGFEVAEEARVSIDQAASWGAPKTLGARTALLRPASGAPCFIRLVEQPAVLTHLPLRTFGWASFEISVRDVNALRQRLEGSGFRVIGEPRHVEGFTTFIPMQAVGRAGEVVYLNQVLESMADLDLPPARADVDQMFIAVLAAPDREASVRFHVDALGFEEGETYVIPYGVINDAFGLSADTKSAVTMTCVGRLPGTEIDGYPPAATPRMVLPGYLPPGNSMISFAVRALDAIKAPFVSAPRTLDGPLYMGRRTATVAGAAGELIELIEVG
jgi:catechol 2,3-dioxygenase-like lactoylglutathione lyase family enzyme